MKLWGGRFSKETNTLVEKFNGSIEIDKILYKEDIEGSIAHCKMLGKCEIISIEDSEKIIEGLTKILDGIVRGKLSFNTKDEDIHMNIERLLVEEIGDVGKKLHTARSRNDQVALDFRMYLKKEIIVIKEYLINLMNVLINIAEKNKDTLMPGYTHLQRAQPITFAYHMMAYFEMFKRDVERLNDCYKRVDVLPLGSAALAGTTYNIDRAFVARELNFDSISVNSMDAISDRDFAIEFLSLASILMMHLSRFCEELILWSTKEFGFVEMDDSFSTGSSIMPQKKNPDVAELIRGKCGSVYGSLMNLLTIMKGLPLAYNKDMQEDKEPVFKTVDTLKSSIEIFTLMLDSITINKDSMFKATREGFMNATDVADYLVKKGIAFREAHEAVGAMVLYCLNQKKSIEDLSLKELKSFSPAFKDDIADNLSIENCINSKISLGGTSKDNVDYMISLGKTLLNKLMI